MFISLSSHTLIFILYISPLQPDKSLPVILFFLYILSTQPLLNNPISTTYPISILSTQLFHLKCNGYVSAQYNQKNREPEQFFQTVPTPRNSLFPALFRYSISPPVTSTQHTQHALKFCVALTFAHNLVLFLFFAPMSANYKKLHHSGGLFYNLSKEIFKNSLKIVYSFSQSTSIS